MNINPAAAALIAGTARAAAKGGDSDARASQDTARQSAARAPGGKDAADTSIEAGDQTSDRDANGRQVLDIFERNSDESKQEDSEPTPRSDSQRQSNHEGHLDLEA